MKGYIMKQCTKCGETKELTLFYKRKDSSDGYRTACKACYNKQSKAYSLSNKSSLSEYQKVYANKNKEQLKEYRKQYNEDNFDEIAKKKKAYYRANREKTLEYNRDYYENNRESIIYNSIKYGQSMPGKMSKRAVMQKRKLQKTYTNDGTLTKDTLSDLYKKQKGQCKYCDELLDFSVKHSVHLDHVIPLSKGGSHSISNVVWSCKSCNLRKSDKMI